MAVRLRSFAVLALTALSLSSAADPPPALAGGLERCAQRVIRDWYSGGRVDRVYPLPCYRAAIRSLPNDVLAYSDADQDIRRALAFAQHGRGDPGDDGKSDDGKTAAPAPPNATPSVPTASPPRAPTPSPVARDAVSPLPRAVSDAAEPAVGASVPYPVIVLAALSGVLLASGAAGWLASRGR